MNSVNQMLRLNAMIGLGSSTKESAPHIGKKGLTMTGQYTRYEGIKPTIKMQLSLPSRSFKYEVHPNAAGDDTLHTIYPHRPMKAIELSVMTEGELLRLREFWNRAIDDALVTVRELDAKAQEALKQGRPSKRLYRPESMLLFFPEGGGVPDEWEPVEHQED